MTDKDLIRELEISKLQEENEELKSILKGTTHCFDEEEHNRLKEEITNLSKDVDMWNAKYNVVFDENQKLKKQLYELGGVDEFNKHLLTQQKEFINYLENEIKRLNEFNIEPIVDIYKKILQRFKEIIGALDENNKQ